MGYESRLIVGEVFGGRAIFREDPCPMWMNPVAELSLSKMGQGEFATLRSKAKFAGVFLYRSARLEDEHSSAMQVAMALVKDQAPEGSFEADVDWWRTLHQLVEDERIDRKTWEDPYGEPFRRLPFQETIDAMREDQQSQEYRRASMAIAMLEHFTAGFAAGTWTEYDPNTDGTEPTGKLMLIHEGY